MDITYNDDKLCGFSNERERAVGIKYTVVEDLVEEPVDLAFFKAHEKWVKYRTVAEKLQTELSFFVKGIHPYDVDSLEYRESIFLEKIEGIIKEEQIFWQKLNTSKNDKSI